MRILYYVPMAHTPQELGSLKEAVIAKTRQIYGKQQTKEFLRQVEWYWKEVERRIQKAGLYQPETAVRLHIFVDGLPDTNEARVEKIVQELIAQNIPAYLIIKKLRENGTKVYGTEDPELLLQEHRYWTEISQGRSGNPREAQRLLKARDRAIASRIDAVVPEGEIGLLFLGRVHKVIEELEKLLSKFKVIYL